MAVTVELKHDHDAQIFSRDAGHLQSTYLAVT
jgi:hypothetical protein